MTGLPHGTTAQRPAWSDLPEAVRRAIEERLGGPVVSATSAGGGFTSGFASALRAADGTAAFVKAAPPGNRIVADAYRREGEVVPLLPAAAAAPAVLWSLEAVGWPVVAFELVEGRPPGRPWEAGELALVVDAVTRAARALTPGPSGLAMESIAAFDGDFRSWREWAAAGAVPDEFCAGRAAQVRDRGRLAELAALESRWLEAALGDTALHFDIRDDNVILGADGRVHLCDWNWVVRGAGWIDLVVLLVAGHGDGLDIVGILRTNPLLAGVPAEALDGVLAAFAGYFTRASGTALDFPASPWLRVHQGWYRDASLDLLASRLGWG